MTSNGTHSSLSSTAATIKTEIDALLTSKLQQLPALPSPLIDAMNYALLGGGKRMRPLLCCLVADTVAVTRQDSLLIGSAIECIHAYSLIHDDLPAMDDDNLRRGRPTCHVAFGEAQAILAGDALQSLAFEILSDPNWLPQKPQVQLGLVALLANAAGYSGMCGGQAIDLAATGDDATIPHSLDVLTQLHQLKTGALLKACVKMPLLLVNDIDEQHIQLFTKFADNVGLAFQIQDDILDEVGTELQTGKPQGSDSQASKLTYPALLGLDGAKQQMSKLVEEALQALRALPYNVVALESFCDLLLKRDH